MTIMDHDSVDGHVTDRRGFFGRLWLAALAAVGFMARAGQVEAKKVAIPLAKVPALEEVGGGAFVTVKKKKILFIRASEKKVYAHRPVCPHQDCGVKYKKDWGEIRCKCHGSKFSLAGEVQNGPAAKDLKSYPASLSDGKIIVDI